MSRLATSTSSTCSQSVPSRELPSFCLQNSRRSNCAHSSLKSQQAPHCRGLLSTNSERRTPIPSATEAGISRSELNSARRPCFPRSSSKTSMVRIHASRWLSLIWFLRSRSVRLRPACGSPSRSPPGGSVHPGREPVAERFCLWHSAGSQQSTNIDVPCRL
jgi:hypothetical protein